MKSVCILCNEATCALKWAWPPDRSPDHPHCKKKLLKILNIFQKIHIITAYTVKKQIKKITHTAKNKEEKKKNKKPTTSGQLADGVTTVTQQ